jgi:glucose/arabinose dehydrogenase/mono/diheme cytochrome c family protein
MRYVGRLAAALLVFTWISLPLARAAQPPAGALDVELEDLQPGLSAVYRSLADKDASLLCLDPKPAFHLGHSSPHPRIPPGPFEAVWSGVLLWKESGPVTFDAYLGGEVTVTVDGTVVLQGRGESDTAQVVGKTALERQPGVYRFEVRYRSLAGVPARLQVGWKGTAFAREPLPAWNLKHLGKERPEAARREEVAARGRFLVGRLGCARCHTGGFPGIDEPAPGPSLADVSGRIDRSWLLHWLEDPAKLHADARMPALFTADRMGFVERWLTADALLGAGGAREPAKTTGDLRAGRLAFVSIGCAACHQVPDVRREEQADLNRVPLRGLGDRMTADSLAAFLGNPRQRYPDGRMPHLPIPPVMARDIAAYLLEWSKPIDQAKLEPPTPAEVAAVVKRLKVRDRTAAGAALLREKRCAECHPGLGTTQPADVPLTAKADTAGCLSGKTLPRFNLNAPDRAAITAYRAVAEGEKHASPFESRRRQLERAGCVRCHQRDSDRPPPIEEIGSTLGGAYLQTIPFQRTPRLSNPLQKYTHAYLTKAVREGVSGLRPARFSYRMPAFGHDAETLLQAIAEADGDLAGAPEPLSPPPADPTAGSLIGPSLAGFQGYACVGCHVWNGQQLSEADPGAVGTDLTRVAGRIRRDWFDRFVEDPLRVHPGTPMPAVFPRGKPATLRSLLDGDALKQKEVLWSYLALGKTAPSPKPPPPIPTTAPAPGEPPIIAQIPIRLPAGSTVEALCILTETHDLLIYDLGAGTPHSFYTGAQILRQVAGRLRTFQAAGTALAPGLAAPSPWQLVNGGQAEAATAYLIESYDRLADGVRLRARVQFPAGTLEVVETIRIVADGTKRRLQRELQFQEVPAGRSVEVRSLAPTLGSVELTAQVGEAKGSTNDKVFTAALTADKERRATAMLRFELPAAQSPPPLEKVATSDVGSDEARDRPGYRVIAYPRPKTVTGQDLLMPAAVAVHPRDGRVFVASMKLGELFVLRDPTGDGKSARFDNYARGLFQEAFSLRAEEDALYVLHRRNLTRIVETRRDGIADRFERVAALPHGIAETYDYGYGLVRDPQGRFVVSYAPYANRELPGSGGLVRLQPGKPPQEIAYGFRNPVGWCNGPDNEIFFTDNQGEWVATNKLCHIVEGRFYGFPNSAQKEHASKPHAKTAVWVPYDWARSINGVAYDHTGGKFGPFAGQIFMAELMYGGAIIRASLEKVNGEYQGACFPFYGKGMLGPVSLAFDPKGKLYIGGITEPGWMAQPDRGGLFRLDFTGETPFEMQSIYAQPKGFRVVFTKPVRAETARALASWQIEQYRYEYTGAYGSPELDRGKLPIESVKLAEDRRSADLTIGKLTEGRVYMIAGRGVRSAQGEPLVHPQGAYTLNQVPVEKK